MPEKRWRLLPPALAAVLLAGSLAGCRSDLSGAGESQPDGERGERVVQPRQSVTLEKGTAVQVRLVPTLSTETHRAGDRFEATLIAPLAADGRTIAPAGAKVWGKVVEADKGGRVSGRARLAVQLTAIETSAGQTLNISTNTVARTARSTKKKDAQKIGIGTGVGAAIGAIAGGGKGAAIGAAAGAGAGTGAVVATRGAPAVLPTESRLTFRLQFSVTLS